MSKESIVERILSDATENARATISMAEEKAAQIIAEADGRINERKQLAQIEIDEKRKSVLDGKAASARLDSAKILLAEKRRVIDVVYDEALKKLNSLGKAEALALAERLLNEYAEEGDEIVFSSDYKYTSSVANLSVVSEKKLKVSPKTADIRGGFILRGKNSDKNISYFSLLESDREERQAYIAAKLF